MSKVKSSLERPGFTTLPIMVRTHQTKYTTSRLLMSTIVVDRRSLFFRDTMFEIPLPCLAKVLSQIPP